MQRLLKIMSIIVLGLFLPLKKQLELTTRQQYAYLENMPNSTLKSMIEDIIAAFEKEFDLADGHIIHESNGVAHKDYHLLDIKDFLRTHLASVAEKTVAETRVEKLETSMGREANTLWNAAIDEMDRKAGEWLK